MTTALENAMNLDQQKFAADMKNLTPMEQGYYDALAKLGYVSTATETPQQGGYADKIKAAADITRAQMGAMSPNKRQSMVAGLKGKAKTQGTQNVMKATGQATKALPGPGMRPSPLTR